MVLGSNGATATALIGTPWVTWVMYRMDRGSNAATATGGTTPVPARVGRMRYTNVTDGGSLVLSSGKGSDSRGQRNPLEPAQVRP